MTAARRGITREGGVACIVITQDFEQPMLLNQQAAKGLEEGLIHVPQDVKNLRGRDHVAVRAWHLTSEVLKQSVTMVDILQIARSSGCSTVHVQVCELLNVAFRSPL